KVGQRQRTPQVKAVVLPARLIADDAEVLGEQTGERAQQLIPAGQTGNQHKGRAFAPFPILHGVMSEMRAPWQTSPCTKLRSGRRQPRRRCLHASSPTVTVTRDTLSVRLAFLRKQDLYQATRNALTFGNNALVATRSFAPHQCDEWRRIDDFVESSQSHVGADFRRRTSSLSSSA